MTGLAKIPIHHGLNRFCCPLPVFCPLLLRIRNFNLTRNSEIEELSDGHAGVDFDRLADRNFQRPRVTEADITLSRRCVNVDSQSSYTALAFQERYMRVRFSVLLRNTKIELAGNKDEAIARNFEVVHVVVSPRVKDLVLIHREPLAEMHIIAVRSEVLPLERPDDNRTAIHFGQNLFVSEDHTGPIRLEYDDCTG